MKSETIWSEKVSLSSNYKNTVFDVAFRPDGAHLVVAVGNRVMVYDAETGDLMHSLKGHSDYVYAVAYSSDSKRFASGGADKTIIIWTSSCEGMLKYNHKWSIQCLAYNPVTHQLVSATEKDFGLWSPQKKNVQKFEVSAKVLCCAWTNDGQYLALGQFNGHVSLRNRKGTEVAVCKREEPVWTLAWHPSEEVGDLLAVGCWDQTLSFWNLKGEQQGTDQPVGHDPCFLRYYEDGNYLLVGGSDNKVSLHTKEGVFLSTVVQHSSWVWSAAASPRPGSRMLAMGCDDGTVAVHETVFDTVHGLYMDRYTHRASLTDVVIQHLTTGQQAIIKMRDHVKKIAVYQSRLAVQLPSRVLIYETASSDPHNMHYRLRHKINKTLECNLLVVTQENIVLCQERRLQLCDLRGEPVREWVMEADIRYIRVVGGAKGREALLVGLKNGSVVKIFFHNRFPVPIMTHDAPIRCLDLSASRKKLAMVDEMGKLIVRDLASERTLFEASGTNSVAWNPDMEDMLCYSGNDKLCIKTGDFPVRQQQLSGFVVGFKGSKVFCLHSQSMKTIDVPQGASMHQYVQIGDFDRAYQVACLGVTEADWRGLALKALAALSLDVARKALIRIRDERFLDLLTRIEVARKDPQHNEAVLVATVLAHQGLYAEAARLFCKAGHRRKAIEMYLDLRDWDKAKRLVEKAAKADEASGVSMGDLLQRQAHWLVEVKDFKAAAEMFRAAQDYGTAIELMGNNNWLDDLVGLVRKSLRPDDRTHLEQAALHFRRRGHTEYAAETYTKMGDLLALVRLRVEERQWKEGFALAEAHPEVTKAVYGPYARWLTEHDRFDEALLAHTRAGESSQAITMLGQLTRNAVTQNRYNDAGFYFWRLAADGLQRYRAAEEGSAEQAAALAPLADYRWKAQVYFAFDGVNRYTFEPFTTQTPDALFQRAQYVFNITRGGTPFGVSEASSLFCLAKQSKILGAFRTARKAYSRLLGLRLPEAWRNQVELGALSIRAKPRTDKEELVPMCHRCGASSSVLSDKGDVCGKCGHETVRSFFSFEPLPLVRFEVESGVSAEQASQLLRTEPQNSAQHEEGLAVWKQQLEAGTGPIRLGAASLRCLPAGEVFARYWPTKQGASPWQYFRNVVPGLPITLCKDCQYFFYQEDYEFHVLQEGACPFCRTEQP